MTDRERTDKDRTSAAKSRAADSRVAMERPSMTQWSPANALETPPPNGEFRFRWIAEYVNGQHVPNRVQRALREGYSRVSIDELFENHPDFVVDEDLKGDGYARTGGLILMKIPEAFARQREEFYSRQSRERLGAANVLQGIARRDQVVNDASRQLRGAAEIVKSV